MNDLGRALATGFVCAMVVLTKSNVLVIILGMSMIGFIWLSKFTNK